MNFRIAAKADVAQIAAHDKHIKKEEMESLACLGRVLLAEEGGAFAGWLRWNLFWDNTPFMNLLFLLEPYRGHGYGKEMVAFWEKQMREAGYKRVLTSTLSSEGAQHFYRKLGYADCGALLLPGEPLEIFLTKEL